MFSLEVTSFLSRNCWKLYGFMEKFPVIAREDECHCQISLRSDIMLSLIAFSPILRATRMLTGNSSWGIKLHFQAFSRSDITPSPNDNPYPPVFFLPVAAGNRSQEWGCPTN